jgi:hypothetical protein
MYFLNKKQCKFLSLLCTDLCKNEKSRANLVAAAWLWVSEETSRAALKLRLWWQVRLSKSEIMKYWSWRTVARRVWRKSFDALDLSSGHIFCSSHLITLARTGRCEFIYLYSNKLLERVFIGSFDRNPSGRKIPLTVADVFNAKNGRIPQVCYKFYVHKKFHVRLGADWTDVGHAIS